MKESKVRIGALLAFVLEPQMKTWSGKIRSNWLEVPVGK